MEGIDVGDVGPPMARGGRGPPPPVGRSHCFILGSVEVPHLDVQGHGIGATCFSTNGQWGYPQFRKCPNCGEEGHMNRVL